MTRPTRPNSPAKTRDRKGPRSGVRPNGTTWHSYGDGHGPATGTRPDFPKGNSLAVRSGVRTPRVYGELANLLAAGLLEERPDLAAFPEAVAAWASTEAQVVLMRRHLDATGGPVASDGTFRGRMLQDLRALEASAEKRRKPLGLDPLSEAALARERASAATLSVNLESIMSAGAAALAERDGEPVHGRPLPAPDVPGEILAAVAAEGRDQWDAAVAAHPGGIPNPRGATQPVPTPGRVDRHDVGEDEDDAPAEDDTDDEETHT